MTSALSFSDDQIETARKLFAGEVKFVKGVVKLDGLPPATGRRSLSPAAPMSASRA